MKGAIVDIGPEAREQIIAWMLQARLKNMEINIKLTLTSSEQKLEAPGMSPLNLGLLVEL